MVKDVSKCLGPSGMSTAGSKKDTISTSMDFFPPVVYATESMTFY